MFRCRNNSIYKLNILQHTLWFLPDVASCYAMKNLIEQRQNTFYHDYQIIVCAGTKAGIGLEALKPVRKAMENPLNTKTITLSCGKLTTGVTIRPWSIVMANSIRRELMHKKRLFADGLTKCPHLITKKF